MAQCSDLPFEEADPLDLKEIEEPEIPPITCNQCNTSHEAFSEGQADGCASMINADGTIYGSYGSAVADMTVFRFSSAHARIETRAKTGHVCDPCLLKWIAAGQIEETIWT